MKRFFLIALATAALVSQSPAQPENGRGMVREVVRELLNLREEINLTDEQRAAIKGVVKSHKDEIGTQFKSGRDARRSMRQAVEAGGPDSAEALAAADAIAAAARSRALLVARITSEIRPILTPDQLKLAHDARERIEEMIDERLARFAQ